MGYFAIMNALSPFAISLLIGLLVGIEREKSHASQGPMGVRTFLLLSLLGALAGWITEPWIGALVSIFAFTIIVVSYFNSTRPQIPQTDRGLTTEIAGAVVFALGFGSHQDPALVSFLGPLVTLVLIWKEGLHRFSDRIRPSELQASILLLLLGVGVVNLLQDRVIDPWGLFNPKKFGMLVLILAAMEFLSYLAVKFFGERRSPLVIGFLGGLVSSTAVVLSTARQADDKPQLWRQLAATAIVAKIASFILLIFIVSYVSLPLAVNILPPLLVASAIGGLTLLFLGRTPETERAKMQISSPLDIKGVLRLAVLFALILALIALTERFLGETGAKSFAFLAGLFELQGVSMATATLYKQNLISFSGAVLSVQIAIIASLLAKITVSLVITRGKYSRFLAAVFLAMGIAIGGVFWVLSWL